MIFQSMHENKVRRVVGMMSGTSVDGVDAALVEIRQNDGSLQIKLLAFENNPYPEAVREQIFALFRPETATVDKIGYMNFLLGEIYAQSALSVIEKAGLTPADVDFVGSHGQTIWHEPVPCGRDGWPVRYTVQIGEGSVIANRTGLVTVSDFRVADMAAGGQGAPLVPFSEYLLYRREDETLLLQNIGGIGNMTVMPASAKPEEVCAFDTGPGNMIIDAVISALTKGAKAFDDGGVFGAKGTVNEELLALLRQEPYYTRPLPKTTGRELFGTQYTAKILSWQGAHRIPEADLVATVTDLTAWSIENAYEQYVLPKYRASKLVVGGGGSYNKTLLGFLQKRFAPYGVEVQTQEDLGFSSDAKEAVAFALLADRCVRGLPNTLPSVTGAEKPVVMGKISLP
ncbi:anhydro-N-acetylmuramic acid kinase [Acetatifactor aquisgranensis]|uniref:anhydro-N-acetylmuramic acid kinase n=1 Tax=Acetatifactor aquisgranensis TaxID=2941233 RepID=UPI00203ABC21|nr:anhydro-N-acetylmuramic acid kinase [Acetatifactor aquisgranensis]